MEKEQRIDSSFGGNLQNYNADDFEALAESRFGWAIAEQVRDILQGQDYEEQNESALEDIYHFALGKGETQLAESIKSYLDQFKD